MRTVIVGSGLAGITVAENLRQANLTDAVILVTGEKLGIYPRPLLSHGFSREEQRERLVQKTFATVRQSGIEVHEGCEALTIDRVTHRLQVRRSDGREEKIDYTALVLAQGSAASIPPPLRALRKSFFTLNGLEDLDAITALRRQVRNAGRIPEIAILGGGLIGCEVASDLAKAGDKVTLVHSSDRLLDRVLEPEASQRLSEHLSTMGVTVLFNVHVDNVVQDPISNQVTFTQGGIALTPPQDLALLATGFSPRTALAAAAGLTVNRGIVVDACFRTSDPDIYAVGDVAEWGGKIYPFVSPIRNQALHLVALLTGKTEAAWTPPVFKAVLKVHGFKA
jgi:NAD(P)H-nitrite reductase large subunit